jgi:hypothetical protein
MLQIRAGYLIDFVIRHEHQNLYSFSSGRSNVWRL